MTEANRTKDQKHYPVEFGPSDNRRLECSCGNPDPAHADGNRPSNQRTTKALKACAEWLSECLQIGWNKTALDRLEAIWWEFHDDQGRLRQLPDETTGNSARTGYISDVTVRRIGDTSYVVTWQEDGEPCGSETISEKLAHALVRAEGGVSGITDDRSSAD